MKNIFKNLNLGALLTLAFVVTLTVSWKNHENNKLAPQWYLVNETSPSDSDRQIGTNYPGGAPGTECALPLGEMCAIKIDLKSYTGPFPETVEEAQVLHDSNQIEIERSHKTP